MKLKLITAALAFSMASTAYAQQKVAEYGDPAIGNSYGGCVFTQVYGTGGGGYLYTEYSIACTSGTYRVGVSKTWPYSSSWGSGSPVCSFYVPDGAYYAQGDCNNWRLYRR